MGGKPKPIKFQEIPQSSRLEPRGLSIPHQNSVPYPKRENEVNGCHGDMYTKDFAECCSETANQTFLKFLCPFFSEIS